MSESRPRISPLAERVGRWLRPLNRFFDWLYHSKYSPLYRSGTLAVLLLVILLVSGLYLAFFYSVSDPYASLEQIQGQRWLGRWIRALHRYATGGCVLAVLVHILQLMAHGKTWGPRALAWFSGVVLLGLLLISAWSGYVMVWDQHGQALALAGAEVLKLIPFLREPLTQAFNGSAPVNASFFFMNLFLHVALPMGLILLLWVHTSRLSRSVWFPNRTIINYTVISFVLLAIYWPAVLLPKADLFIVPGRINYDFWIGFWLPLQNAYSPSASLGLWLAVLGFLISLPFWWRPKKSDERPRSVVDLELCTGCTQCADDCPYDAIDMFPRPDGKRLIAVVSSLHCVSCGICAASCDDLAIGPPGRDGQDQIDFVREYVKSKLTDAPQGTVVIVSCVSNGKVGKQLREFCADNQGFHLFEVECCGALHSKVLEELMSHASGVCLLGCPARNCLNRDGLDLLAGRVFEKRVPFVNRSIDRSRFLVMANSDAERAEFTKELIGFQSRLNSVSAPKRVSGLPRPQYLRGLLVTPLLLLLIAWGSQLEFGKSPESAFLRLSARLPSQVRQNCRVASPEELAALPAHMRQPQICDQKHIEYQLLVKVDGQALDSRVVSGGGLHAEKAAFVEDEFKLALGEHQLEITLIPSAPELRTDYSYELKESLAAELGRVYLVTLDSGQKRLVIKSRE